MHLPHLIVICTRSEKASGTFERWLYGIAETLICHDVDTLVEKITPKQPCIILLSLAAAGNRLHQLLERLRQAVPLLHVCLIMDDAKLSSTLPIEELLVERVSLPLQKSSLLKMLESLLSREAQSVASPVSESRCMNYQEAIERSFIITHHDRYGLITEANQAYFGLFGTDALSDIALNPLLDGGKLDSEMLRQLECGAVWRGRRSIFLFDGEEKIVDITASPIYNAAGDMEEILVFLEDSTEVVMKGRAQQKTQNQMKLERLLVQKRHNEEINRIKDSFLTVFTHELRTPLNAIINFSEHVSKHLSKAELKKKSLLLEEMAQIRYSGVQILEMIDNVALAMRLRDRGVSANYESIRLKDLIVNLLAGLMLKADAVSVMIPDNAVIESDYEHLRTILYNLLSNAMKYGKGAVAIGGVFGENRFEFYISDNGAGFRERVKVFHLFEQADTDTMTRTGKGAGVGLYVVKKLCDVLEYTIELGEDSELGGAKVTIAGNTKGSYA